MTSYSLWCGVGVVAASIGVWWAIYHMKWMYDIPSTKDNDESDNESREIDDISDYDHCSDEEEDEKTYQEDDMINEDDFITNNCNQLECESWDSLQFHPDEIITRKIDSDEFIMSNTDIEFQKLLREVHVMMDWLENDGYCKDV